MPDEGKKVFITGAGAGIGKAIAKAFASAGATLVLADIDGRTAEATASMLRETGADCYGMVLDVSDPAAVANAVAAAAREMAGLDSVIANAGIALGKSFLDTTPEEFQRIHTVNLIGAFATLRAGAREMVARSTQGGSLIAIASVTGLRGSANRVAYASSKAALINLVQTAAVELGPKGIRANAVCPGPIETPLVQELHTSGARAEWLSRLPQGRYGAPREVADLVLFLASEQASYINGQAIAIDGAWSATGLMPA